MKRYIALFLLALSLLTLTACKKEEPVVEPPVDDKPPVVEPPVVEPPKQEEPPVEPKPEKYVRPDPGNDLAWNLEVAGNGPLDENRHIHGIEFDLIEDKEGYEVRYGLGDNDKITGIRLYNDRIEVYLNADYQMVYAGTIGAVATVNRPEGSERAQETAENYTVTAGEAGKEHLITVKFERPYPDATIFNLHFMFGKLD